MTAAPFPPPITCPSGLIASCAPLLGFTPERCLVAFVHGVPDRDSPVLLRVDLPPAAETAAAARHLALGIAGTGGAAVDTVAWVEDPDDAMGNELSSSDFHLELGTRLAHAHIEVGTVLSTNSRVWWSHQCQDPHCCPPMGTPLDRRAMDAVRAEFVFSGVAPLSNREQVADRVRRDPDWAADVSRVVQRRSAPPATSRWRDSQIRFLTQLLTTDSCETGAVGLTASRAARLHWALADVRVRDVMLHRLVLTERTCRDCWARTLDTLCHAVRGAPDGHVAPAATVLALVAWLRGDGALANVSLRRAEAEPGYRLAELAAQLIAQGTDPRLWRESLSTLTEAECRDPSGGDEG